MSSKKTVKGELPVDAKVERVSNEDRAYRQPAVYDLGKLELMQGGAGITADGAQAYFWRP